MTDPHLAFNQGLIVFAVVQFYMSRYVDLNFIKQLSKQDHCQALIFLSKLA